MTNLVYMVIIIADVMAKVKSREVQPAEEFRFYTLTFYVNFKYTSRMQMKLELVAIPVTDVDRAKAFYTEKVGFNADHDHKVSEAIRFVQLTPPGSACSIAIGKGVTSAPPGSVQGMQLTVADIDAAKVDLAGRGVE